MMEEQEFGYPNMLSQNKEIGISHKEIGISLISIAPTYSNKA